MTINEVCKICGLPTKICVCEFIKQKNKRKSAIKRLFKKQSYKDDLEYCFDCRCYHYPGCHKKTQIN